MMFPDRPRSPRPADRSTATRHSRRDRARGPGLRYRPGLEPIEERCLLSGGLLDPTFGTGGLVSNTIGSSSRALAVATYPNAGTVNDGKVVAVGDAYAGARAMSTSLAVARYNLNGTLDTSFGGTGSVLAGAGHALAVQIEPDGRVLAAGLSASTGGGFLVVRLNTNGTLDTNFGTKGQVTTVISKNSTDVGEAMILQPDGKIVVAGVTNPQNTSFQDLALVRYNANGSLDTTFGSGGKATTRLASPLASSYTSSQISLALDRGTGIQDPNSGKLVVGASLRTGGAVIARYNASGALDTGFGISSGHPGSVTIAELSNPSVAVQPDDRVAVAGVVTDATTTLAAIGLDRLNADGTIDTSFGTGGAVVTASAPDENVAHAVTLQPDGDILVAGDRITSTTGGHGFIVARYLSDGSLDSGFGVNGIATGGANGGGQGRAVALEPDGRIIVAGFTSGQFPGAFSLARFLVSSTPILATTAAAGTKMLTTTQTTIIGPGPGPDELLLGPVIDRAPNDVGLFHLARRRASPGAKSPTSRPRGCDGFGALATSLD